MNGDKLIRAAMTAVVVAVAGFAAVVSYSHIYGLGRAHGQDGAAARLLPLSVDGLIVAASLVLLHEARNGRAAPGLARVMLWLGIAATVNGYGVMARRHWERWLPEQYAAIEDPDTFFTALGEEAAAQVGDLAARLAGDDQPGGGYLERAGRLASARARAEEMVLPQRVLPPPEAFADDEQDDGEGLRLEGGARPPAVDPGHPAEEPPVLAGRRRRVRYAPDDRLGSRPVGGVAVLPAQQVIVNAGCVSNGRVQPDRGPLLRAPRREFGSAVAHGTASWWELSAGSQRCVQATSLPARQAVQRSPPSRM